MFNKKESKRKTSPTETYIWTTTILSDERKKQVIDADFIRKAEDSIPVLKQATPDMLIAEVVAHAHVIAEPPENTKIYAVLPVDKGTGSSWFPVMFHRDLGEVYYAKVNVLKAFADGKLEAWRNKNTKTIYAINWITGKSYYVGHPVDGYIPEAIHWYERKDWDQHNIAERWVEERKRLEESKKSGYKLSSYVKSEIIPEAPTLHIMPLTVMSEDERNAISELPPLTQS